MSALAVCGPFAHAGLDRPPGQQSTRPGGHPVLGTAPDITNPTDQGRLERGWRPRPGAQSPGQAQWHQRPVLEQWDQRQERVAGQLQGETRPGHCRRRVAAACTSRSVHPNTSQPSLHSTTAWLNGSTSTTAATCLCAEVEGQRKEEDSQEGEGGHAPLQVRLQRIRGPCHRHQVHCDHKRRQVNWSGLAQACACCTRHCKGR